jgi:hypothetical protein
MSDARHFCIKNVLTWIGIALMPDVHRCRQLLHCRVSGESMQVEPVTQVIHPRKVAVSFTLVLYLSLREQGSQIRDIALPAGQDEALADFDEAVRSHRPIVPHRGRRGGAQRPDWTAPTGN